LDNQSSLLILDLSSYGSALAIINQFCDGKSVEVFEISPIGTAAILILEIKDRIASTLLKNEILSFFKSSILSSRLIEKYDLRILKVYLSQNNDSISNHLLIQEFSFVSEAFVAAQELLSKNISVIDFRVIRTFPMNIILTSSDDSMAKLVESKNLGSPRVATLIEKVEPTLKEYYQVVKN
jgi:hypothetical protein